MIMTGLAFMRNVTDIDVGTVIHQTCKAKSELYTQNSWTRHHPEALHVRWSDEDNYELVSAKYPHLVSVFKGLFLPIQKVDMVRIMYVHSFGGLYVDMDYVAHTNVLSIFHSLNVRNAIVQSPFLMHEYVQNSLLFAKEAEHSFWNTVLLNIASVHAFIMSGCDVSAACSIVPLFSVPVIGHVMHLFMTQHTTGSAMLDKTIVMCMSEGIQTDLAFLNMSFFSGPIAKHNHDNSWLLASIRDIYRLLLYTLFAISASMATVCMFKHAQQVGGTCHDAGFRAPVRFQ